ncbi:unnamed protein product, partial [Rotaria magnacalcarata]
FFSFSLKQGKPAETTDAAKTKEEPSKASAASSGPAPRTTPSVPTVPKGPLRETPTSQISVTPATQMQTATGIDPHKITGT